MRGSQLLVASRREQQGAAITECLFVTGGGGEHLIIGDTIIIDVSAALQAPLETSALGMDALERPCVVLRAI